MTSCLQRRRPLSVSVSPGRSVSAASRGTLHQEVSLLNGPGMNTTEPIKWPSTAVESTHLTESRFSPNDEYSAVKLQFEGFGSNDLFFLSRSALYGVCTVCLYTLTTVTDGQSHVQHLVRSRLASTDKVGHNQTFSV